MRIAASCAIPGLFAPVAINDSLHIDGGVGQITHIDIAVGAGAQTLLVFNPFVPVDNDRAEVCFADFDGSCATLGEKGFFYVVEQAGRISRAAKLKQETHHLPRVFVVEPEPHKALAFLQSPVTDRGDSRASSSATEPPAVSSRPIRTSWPTPFGDRYPQGEPPETSPLIRCWPLLSCLSMSQGDVPPDVEFGVAAAPWPA